MNLLDWSVNNVFVIVFGNIVYFWDVIMCFIVEFLIVDEDGLVISVYWVFDGRYFVVGLNNVDV